MRINREEYLRLNILGEYTILMQNSYQKYKGLSFCIFTILAFLGVLYLLAAPADSSTSLSRLLVGITLLCFAILILVISLLLIQKRTDYGKKGKIRQGENILPSKAISEIVCQNCRNYIEINEDLRHKDTIICEKCGNEIQLPKDNLNW